MQHIFYFFCKTTCVSNLKDISFSKPFYLLACKSSTTLWLPSYPSVNTAGCYSSLPLPLSLSFFFSLFLSLSLSLSPSSDGNLPRGRPKARIWAANGSFYSEKSGRFCVSQSDALCSQNLSLCLTGPDRGFM
jgi:hypothetical protein